MEVVFVVVKLIILTDGGSPPHSWKIQCKKFNFCLNPSLNEIVDFRFRNIFVGVNFAQNFIVDCRNLSKSCRIYRNFDSPSPLEYVPMKLILPPQTASPAQFHSLLLCPIISNLNRFFLPNHEGGGGGGTPQLNRFWRFCTFILFLPL